MSKNFDKHSGNIDKLWADGQKDIQRRIDQGEIASEADLDAAFAALNAKIEQELDGMRQETVRLKNLAATIATRISVRDQLRDRGVQPKMIQAALALLRDALTVRNDGTTTGPDGESVAAFVDQFLEGEGRPFLSNETNKPSTLASDLARNLG